MLNDRSVLEVERTAYKVLNVDRRLLVKTFVGEQNYFEFNSLGNWKPVQVE